LLLSMIPLIRYYAMCK